MSKDQIKHGMSPLFEDINEDSHAGENIIEIKKAIKKTKNRDKIKRTHG